LQYTDCRSRKEAGAWIAHTPGKLAAEYAIGDVDRTKALWDLLSPIIWKRDMQDAYVREQELMPITYYSEKQGVRVDTEELLKDLPIFEKTLDQVERRLCKRMKVKYLEFNKNEQVADALENAGLVQPEDWIKTPTGRRSTSKDNLDAAVKDPTLLALMRYRGALAGCLQTFARPWAELSAEDGRIHTTWNQVRTHDAGFKDSRGSRTGRLSGSKPSLMNVTTELSIVVPQGVRPPPLMRKYLLPEKGHVWLKRDYSSQEVRILAHLENGTLMEAYRVDPNLDPHEAARQLIHNITQVMFSRKDVKITAFSIVYGSGANSLSKQLGRSLQEATLIKEAYLNAFPGVRALQRQVSKRGKAGKSIRTWGGREYYVEPSRLLHGRRIDFAYKLLNYLIQGSAADQTKQCITDWWETKPKEDVFLATVHDEINISAPKKTWKNSMKHLQTSMDQDLFDLPMRSEGFYGPNWHATKACP